MQEKEKPIINVFKALRKLQSGCSIKELAFSLNVELRTAYRYKDIIEKIGYQLEKNETTNRYKLKTVKNSPLALTFSQEEVDYILDHISGEDHFFAGIKQKLYINSDIQFIPDRLLEVEFGMNIQKLRTAILNRKRVVLREYNSVNTNSCRDILLEPVHMEDHYKRLYAYDLEKKKIIQYKTERIGVVEILDQSQFFTGKLSKKIETDVFWWILDKQKWEIELLMSRGAYFLMKEDYPRIESKVKEVEEGKFKLATEVADLRAVASMILRMPGEFEVISPPELEKEIAHKVMKLPFFDKYFSLLS